MKLSKLIRVWEILHQKDTGDIGFCDLCNAIMTVEPEENDIACCQPIEQLHSPRDTSY